MKECWDFEPNERPSYQKVLELLRTCKVSLPECAFAFRRWNVRFYCRGYRRQTRCFRDLCYIFN